QPSNETSRLVSWFATRRWPTVWLTTSTSCFYWESCERWPDESMRGNGELPPILWSGGNVRRGQQRGGGSIVSLNRNQNACGDFQHHLTALCIPHGREIFRH